jgi:hypothetical protein
MRLSPLPSHNRLELVGSAFRATRLSQLWNSTSKTSPISTMYLTQKRLPSGSLFDLKVSHGRFPV